MKWVRWKRPSPYVWKNAQKQYILFYTYTGQHTQINQFTCQTFANWSVCSYPRLMASDTKYKIKAWESQPINIILIINHFA